MVEMSLYQISDRNVIPMARGRASQKALYCALSKMAGEGIFRTYWYQRIRKLWNGERGYSGIIRGFQSPLQMNENLL